MSDMKPSPLGMKKATSGYGGSIGVASAEQVAEVVLFLPSDDAVLINGVAMPVDSDWYAC